MIDRRTLIAGLGAGAALGVRAAAAQAPNVAAWKAQYPELVFAAVPSENATGMTDKMMPLVNYLQREIGLKITMRIANDYAAVIEGQRAGNIHIASYGPTSFARALMQGVPTEAIVIDVYGKGAKGYYSVFWVKADSPYKTIQDLKGKNLGIVDPNSASGYTIPLFTLDKMGIVADKFFAKVQSTGSHENAIIALNQGIVDVATNWYNADDESNLQRMVGKGMLKSADGKPMKVEDFRIVLKSDLIINSPWAVLSTMPADLKAAIKKAFLEAHVKDKAAFDKLSDGKNWPWEAIDNAAYEDTIKMVKFTDALKKKQG